jgi:hypothetical protein
MSTSSSVAEILARLEARIAHHEEQVAFHQQEAPRGGLVPSLAPKGRNLNSLRREPTLLYTSRLLEFVTSEIGEDRAGLAAAETPRRPRGLRRVS